MDTGQAVHKIYCISLNSTCRTIPAKYRYVTVDSDDTVNMLKVKI